MDLKVRDDRRHVFVEIIRTVCTITWIGEEAMDDKLNLALIAHDNKKAEMVAFAFANRDVLRRYEIYATGTTGKLISEKTGLTVNRMLSGPYGGDQQIGAKVASGEIDLVIFLRDPLTALPHDPDISALLRVCDVHNVPVATNLATAELVLAAFSHNAFTR